MLAKQVFFSYASTTPGCPFLDFLHGFPRPFGMFQVSMVFLLDFPMFFRLVIFSPFQGVQVSFKLQTKQVPFCPPRGWTRASPPLRGGGGAGGGGGAAGTRGLRGSGAPCLAAVFLVLCTPFLGLQRKNWQDKHVTKTFWGSLNRF